MIESNELIPEGHFGGGKNLTQDEEEGLRSILNAMKTAEVARGGFAYMGLGAASQSGPEIDDHVEWSEASISGDSISLATGAGQANGIISLVAGYTYKVSFGLDVEMDSTEEAIIAVYDRTQDAVLDPDSSATVPKLRCRAVGATGGKCGLTVSSFLFTPSVNTDFDIRVESVSGGGSVDGISNFSWLTIEVLG
jgi:hypothetical protein